MSYTLPVNYLILLFFLLTACGGDPAPPVDPAVEKRREWRAASPFQNLTDCPEAIAEIGPDCCRKVVADYARLLRDPGGYDLAEVTTKDPFLNACKALDPEFLEAIDHLEHPVENEDDAPF